MLRYTQGNLLEASTEALVNTVNEVGVLGKGIALQFRDAFPGSARAYEQACKRKEVQVGRVLLTETGNLSGPRWVIHFPTKKHWRNPSQLQWVRDGLKDLARVLHERAIRSVAIPPMGCGNGGLDWTQVKREIELALGALPDVEVHVYEPTRAYHTAPKRTGVETLTHSRALVAELVRRYGVLGIECSHLEVQKLAWFLQRVIQGSGLEDPLRLHFKAKRYGPYADDLRQLLDHLDGSYLHSEKRLADAGPLDPIWFEESRRSAVADHLGTLEARPYAKALDATTKLIDGFESPLGMELLATVDWLLKHEKCEHSVPSIRRGLESWPGGKGAAQRKGQLFDDRLLGIALARLSEHASVLA